MIEGYARGMLKVVHQKTKHPDRPNTPTETLLKLREIVEANGYVFDLKLVAEEHANIGIDNKPHRINLGDDLPTILAQLEIAYVEPETVEIQMATTGVEITSAALALIEEHEIDLALITGTGADGKILKRDVELHLEEIKE